MADSRKPLSPESQSQESKNARMTFPTIDALLDFVTMRWNERWVMVDIRDDAVLDKLLLRPFFLLVSIDAPITLRWRRFNDRSLPLV